MRRESVCGLNLAVGGVDEAIAEIISRVTDRQKSPTVLVHGNCHTLYVASRNSDLKHALSRPDVIILLEGIALKLALGLARARWLKDVSGTDLILPTLKALSPGHPRLALIGGAPGVAKQAASSLAKEHAEIDVVAVLDGFQDLHDPQGALEVLSAARPDIILLGLGTPFQELAATSWLLGSGADLIWAVGGFLDFFGNDRPFAPIVARRLRLEWLFRLVMEPRRLWRRTFLEAPWLALQLLSLSRELRP